MSADGVTVGHPRCVVVEHFEVDVVFERLTPRVVDRVGQETKGAVPVTPPGAPLPTLTVHPMDYLHLRDILADMVAYGGWDAPPGTLVVAGVRVLPDRDAQPRKGVLRGPDVTLTKARL